MHRAFLGGSACIAALVTACASSPASLPPATTPSGSPGPGASAVIAPAAPPATAAAAPGGRVELDFATITTSPSTNTPGIVVVVRADGSAHWDTTPLGHGLRMCREDHGDLALGAPAKALIVDIALGPHLADLPTGSCVKPASFGTTTTLDHFGDKTGDLSCPASDPRTKKIAGDVSAVEGAVLQACR